MEDNLPFLRRQIQDVISQAIKLKTSDNFDDDYLAFISYVKEINQYINENVKEERILERIKKLPNLTYKKLNQSIIFVLLVPYYLGVLYINYQQKRIALQKIQEVSSCYSSIEFLLGK